MGVPGYSRGTAGVTGCAAAAAWPRTARAVLFCAGRYVSGVVGSNECPAGSVWIETEAACRTAAAAAFKTVGSPFVETDAFVPRGCYYITGGGPAYFNTDTVGTGQSGTRLLCAAFTTGAPSTPLRARACV